MYENSKYIYIILGLYILCRIIHVIQLCYEVINLHSNFFFLLHFSEIPTIYRKTITVDSRYVESQGIRKKFKTSKISRYR